MGTSGCASWTARTPSGAAIRLMQLDARRAPVLEHLDRGRGGPAGGEHRIEDQAQVDGRGVGQLVVVLDRPQRPLVAEQAQVPDLCRGHQLEHRVDHAQARAQDGHQADSVGQSCAVQSLQSASARGPARHVRVQRAPRSRAATRSRARARETSWASWSASRSSASLCSTAGCCETCRPGNSSIGRRLYGLARRCRLGSRG